MDGRHIRMRRFLARSEKLVIAAIDHGMFHGPIRGIEDPLEVVPRLGKADALLASSGLLPHVAEKIAGPGGPLIITRLAWNSTYCFQWRYSASHHQPLVTVAQAMFAGADFVLASLSINTGSEKVDSENAALFSSYVQQAHELGIPFLGEFFPANVEQMSRQELHENIKIGCRVAAELGADMIKTFYTGPDFDEVIMSTPVPIFVLGAEKTPTEREALQLAANAAERGARGIAFGRNIFQSASPNNFIDAVKAVMNKETSLDEAIRQYGLGGSK